jgi:hypothetical protein
VTRESELSPRADSDAQQKIAPRVRGTEDRKAPNESECPICFMHYPLVNTTSCCHQPICSECFLQVRPPRRQTACPFCNSNEFSVSYTLRPR